MRAERRAAAGAIGDYLEALIDEPLVENALERPPDGLDILVVIGDIGLVHVHPIAHALGHAFPFVLVFPDAFLAFFDEGLDAVFLYLLLAVYAQRLLHFELDGQPVRVPTGFAQDVKALHGLVTGNDVFHHARQDMTYVRLAVGGRGTVVKGERRRSLILFHALCENIVLLPKRYYLFFSLTKVHVGVYFVVHFIPPRSGSWLPLVLSSR